MYNIFKRLQTTLEDLGQITAVGMRPAGEFYRSDRIEISGMTNDGMGFELTVDIKKETADDT